MAAALQTAVQAAVSKRSVAGAVVLVADRERVLAVSAVGWSDVETKSAMRADTLFWVASMSKSITGAAAMMLVDDGRPD